MLKRNLQILAAAAVLLALLAVLRSPLAHPSAAHAAEPTPGPPLPGFPPGLVVEDATGDAASTTTEITFEMQVLELINQERWANGQLPPLKGTDPLEMAAETHSQNMAERNFFDHCDLDTGDSPWDRMAAAGYTSYSSAGENIAAGYTSPEVVMDAWMASSGHRANILSENFREVGVGYHFDAGDQSTVRFDDTGDCLADRTSGPYFYYWTQNFGRRNGKFPVVINREAAETDTRSVILYVYGAGWAEDMRICNDNNQWTDWSPFATDVLWTLTPGSGTKTVMVALRHGEEIRFASDQITLNEAVTTVQSPPSAQIWLPLITNGAFTVTDCTLSFPDS